MAIQTLKNHFNYKFNLPSLESDFPLSSWEKVSQSVLSFFSTVAGMIYHFFSSLAPHSITPPIEQKNIFESQFPLPDPFQHDDLQEVEDPDLRVIIHPSSSTSIEDDILPAEGSDSEFIITNQINFSNHY